MARRNVEVGLLMRAFARAFEVQAPAVSTLPAFREFTAACMEAALVDGAVAARYRARLGEEARRLGAHVRSVPGVRLVGPSRVARWLYRGIGIELRGDMPGEVRFGPCAFAERYTPADCWFMSAFDEGFMRGITGCDEGSLAFRCRLTEGACCCRAWFGIEEGD